MILSILFLLIALVPSPSALIQRHQINNIFRYDKNSLRTMTELDNTASDRDNETIECGMNSGDGKENVGNSKYKEDWKTVVDRFKKSVLHDSYLPVPIRGGSVNVGDQYPSSFPDQPGLMPIQETITGIVHYQQVL